MAGYNCGYHRHSDGIDLFSQQAKRIVPCFAKYLMFGGKKRPGIQPHRPFFLCGRAVLPTIAHVWPPVVPSFPHRRALVQNAAARGVEGHFPKHVQMNNL